MIKNLKIFSTFLLVSGFVFAVTTDVIKERQSEFDGIKGNMQIIGKAVKAGATDKKAIAKNAKEMAGHFVALKQLFPKNSRKGLTDANANIWKDPNSFQMALDYSANTANALAVAAQKGKDVPTAFKKVAETCKSCHKKYRKPKDQSYKKK